MNVQDLSRINQKLIEENSLLKQRIKELEYSEAERKRAEEALRKSEENFRRSLDDSPLGARIVSATGETIYANQALLDIYGYARIEELRATPTKERYTPESYAEYLTRREKRQRGEFVPYEYEICIFRKDGKIRSLQIFRKQILWNGASQFQVLYNDITERKQAEKDLKKNKEMLRLITENMSDMIRVTDFQGNNLYLSPSHYKGLGRRPEERIGKSTFDIVHPDDVELIINKFMKEHNSKQPVRLEYRVRHADGHYVWMETVADTLRDAQGKTTNFVMSSRDISERKQAEDDKRSLEGRLNRAEKMEAMGTTGRRCRPRPQQCPRCPCRIFRTAITQYPCRQPFAESCRKNDEGRRPGRRQLSRTS